MDIGSRVNPPLGTSSFDLRREPDVEEIATADAPVRGTFVPRRTSSLRSLAVQARVPILLTSLVIPGVWLIALVLRRSVSYRAAKRSTARAISIPSISGVTAVDDRMWRGPAPTRQGYEDLATAGVGLVVDLRAEANLEEVADNAEPHGLAVLALPTANGRPPAPEDVARLAERQASVPGITYVHCAAGEGRTGAIVGAYQASSGTAVADAIHGALANGSLTFAQLGYIATRGRRPLLVSFVDWTLDRPTERLFDLAR